MPGHRLQVVVILVGQRHLRRAVQFPLVICQHVGINLDLGRGKGGLGDKLERRVADELACEPEEGLLEVVVGLGRDVVVLQVLLAVEGDGLGLDFALLDVDLVASQDNGDVLAHTDQVA